MTSFLACCVSVRGTGVNMRVCVYVCVYAHAGYQVAFLSNMPSLDGCSCMPLCVCVCVCVCVCTGYQVALLSGLPALDGVDDLPRPQLPSGADVWVNTGL